MNNSQITVKSKLNKLLTLLPEGGVLTSQWLTQNGYSPELVQKYRKSNWLESIGVGAMIRSGESVDYLGGVNALQEQLNLSIHPAGRTALSILGYAHFVDLGPKPVFLFGSGQEKLPIWFRKHDWGVDIHYFTSSFLPAGVGMTTINVGNINVKVSQPARALLECLYLTPKDQDIVECYHLMQNLNNLHPKTVNFLLSSSQSIKVNRLFLYMAEKANHEWFNYINLEKVNLGNGNRSIVRNGVFNDKYKITVPRELADNDIPEL